MVDENEIRLTLRLPASLRDKLSEKAGSNGRSLNAEILTRIERTLAEEDQYDSSVYDMIGDLNEQVEKLASKLDVLWAVYQGRDPYNHD
ncbi:Arc family DNA-binding protein [Rhizobium alvei]|uniref:Arc family DNA-binding protein n=1 Tax=Rhizobium alvei TaxID=1132659 RepID=A0ABT8YK01_9HYPH|nr:Arc family DNA-binding protein [Rhizobium alvei]MDO6963980.1 Arc family DNA-binding protein [Rhizobium alvei]